MWRSQESEIPSEAKGKKDNEFSQDAYLQSFKNFFQKATTSSENVEVLPVKEKEIIPTNKCDMQMLPKNFVQEHGAERMQVEMQGNNNELTEIGYGRKEFQSQITQSVSPQTPIFGFQAQQNQTQFQQWQYQTTLAQNHQWQYQTNPFILQTSSHSSFQDDNSSQKHLKKQMPGGLSQPIPALPPPETNTPCQSIPINSRIHLPQP